ncbi:MAG: hypothetical protein R2698_04680 [Microthrixaceae bacterium]
MDRRRFIRTSLLAGGGVVATASTCQPPVSPPSSTTTTVATPTTQPPPTPPIGTGRFGYNLYDSQLVSPEHLNFLASGEAPTVIRWLLAWDRYHLLDRAAQQPYTGSIPNPPNWETLDGGAYARFFDRCMPTADNPRGIMLVVQLQCKDGRHWAGDNPGDVVWNLRPGTSWARPFTFGGQMWPDDPTLSYQPFVHSLVQALDARGLNYQIGAWNEPDWRTMVPSEQARTPITPWLTAPNTWGTGWNIFGWSGGAGANWDALQAAAPARIWNTCGIQTRNAAGELSPWVAPLAAKSEIRSLDLHLYYGRATDQYPLDVERTVQWAATQVADFDAASPAPRPFVVGEFGPSGSEAVQTVAEAARIYWRHTRLVELSGSQNSPLNGRYLGCVQHNGLPWEAADADVGRWWQYKPVYEDYRGT